MFIFTAWTDWGKKKKWKTKQINELTLITNDSNTATENAFHANSHFDNPTI